MIATIPAANPIGAFLPLIIGFALIYLLMIRPQKKREKDILQMRSNLQVGDVVMTIGGIKGKIIKIGDDFLTIESGSSKTRIEFGRSAIYQVVTKDETDHPVEEIEIVETEDEI